MSDYKKWNIKPLSNSFSESIKDIMSFNDYLKSKMDDDLLTLGIACVKVDKSGKVEYIDPMLPENQHLFENKTNSKQTV